jgi:NADPH:quinone reductase-like Zn-dependent oxidoreductase
MNRVQYDHYGGADVMRMGKFDVPLPKRGQVRVNVKAAAINPLDWKQRQGGMKLFMNRRFPKGMGSDFAGVVDAVGEDISDFQVGDEVLGTMDFRSPGAFAEVLVAEARLLVRMPAELSFAEAACLPIPGATAWAALLHKGQVSRRSRVLVNGCTGAVGSMAVQLARSRGALVAGICSSASMDRARQAGIDPILDYADPSLWPRLDPFDVILDTAGTLELRRGMAMLKPSGVFIDINPTPGRLVRGMLSRRYRLVFAAMATGHLPEIADLAARGTLKASIAQESRFAEALETITAVEKGLRVPGRVVLTF